MNNRKDILRLLIFIETLKIEEPIGWSVPCIGSSDAFDIEWSPFDSGAWKYKQKDMNDWIELPTFSLLPTLEKNNVNLNTFKTLLMSSILNKVTYAYNIVQEAVGIFGEDAVYQNIEDKHDQLERELERLLGNKGIKPELKIIQTEESE